MQILPKFLGLESFWTPGYAKESCENGTFILSRHMSVNLSVSFFSGTIQHIFLIFCINVNIIIGKKCQSQILNFLLLAPNLANLCQNDIFCSSNKFLWIFKPHLEVKKGSYDFTTVSSSVSQSEHLFLGNSS